MTDSFAAARKGRIEHYRRRAEEAAELIRDGVSWYDAARYYGVSDVRGFKDRVQKYVGKVVPRSPEELRVRKSIREIHELVLELKERVEKVL